MQRIPLKQKPLTMTARGEHHTLLGKQLERTVFRLTGAIAKRETVELEMRSHLETTGRSRLNGKKAIRDNQEILYPSSLTEFLLLSQSDVSIELF